MLELKSLWVVLRGPLVASYNRTMLELKSE